MWQFHSATSGARIKFRIAFCSSLPTWPPHLRWLLGFLGLGFCAAGWYIQYEDPLKHVCRLLVRSLWLSWDLSGPFSACLHLRQELLSLKYHAKSRYPCDYYEKHSSVLKFTAYSWNSSRIRFWSLKRLSQGCGWLNKIQKNGRLSRKPFSSLCLNQNIGSCRCCSSDTLASKSFCTVQRIEDLVTSAPIL